MRSINGMRIASAVAAALLAGACVAPGSPGWERTSLRNVGGMGGTQSSPYGISSPARASATPAVFQDGEQFPLYGRDGGVVDSRTPGSVTNGAPSHDVEATGPGRMYILELYQAAIDEPFETDLIGRGARAARQGQ